MSPFWRTFIAAAVLLSSACAGGGRPRSDAASNILGRAELADAGSVSTYEAVKRLRPDFLRDRGPKSLVNASVRTRPAVFIDGSPYGEIEALAAFPASRVEEVRFYSGLEATTKFGSAYGAGVIQLKLRMQ